MRVPFEELNGWNNKEGMGRDRTRNKKACMENTAHGGMNWHICMINH